MLDPGRYLAEAIYFIQYTLAQIMWAINRAFLSIAVIAESINSWVTDNVGYFVELLVNALSAPLGGMFILALTALGFWYALNNIVPTGRWVDPSKLFTYGLIAFFFFSSPIVAIDMMEDLRQSLNAGIDQTLIDGAAGDIFDTNMDGTDNGLPGAIPDVNSDGVIGSFDLVTAFMLVANIDELDSSEFPVDFEAAYFTFGDPSGIDLSDEADQELAKAQASDGIERLFFASVAIPTAIAEHFLHLSLTGVAMFLYAGVPFAMLFAFFIYTQAFLGAYLRQFINLLIETLMSVIIAAIMIGLLAAAAQQGIGLYIGASIITLIVLLWRIKSALKLAAAALNLFGGGMMSGGASGMELAHMGKRAVAGTVGLAGAALTGGAALAVGGAVLGSAAALQADNQAEGAYLGTDPAKTDGRVRQLKTIAGYALGRSESARAVIEGSHEARTFARNFRDGKVQEHDPDSLDYLRAGSSMSGFGSSPWLAMRLSPSLREAFNEIGGRRDGDASRDAVYDGDGEPVDQMQNRERPGNRAGSRGNGNGRSQQSTSNNHQERLPGNGRFPHTHNSQQDQLARLEHAIVALTTAMTTGQPAQPHLTGQTRPEEAADNHPIPDWLQDDVLREDGRPNGRHAQTIPDPINTANDTGLDRDANTDVTRPHSSIGHREAPAIQLEPYDPTRQQTVQATLARLESDDLLTRQAAHNTLVTFTGKQNADLLETAVSTHSATAVNTAAAATANQIEQYRTQGLQDAEILAAFQSGSASRAIRDAQAEQGNEIPLSDAELTAVADMVMLPQRQLTRTELVTVIGQQVASGAVDDQAISAAIGSPIGFGGQTGSIRGVMAGARTMNLSASDLARIADLIRDGLRDVAQQELISRGGQPQAVRELVSDITSLPAALIVPQTARADRRPGVQAETAVHPQVIESKKETE